MFYSAKDQIMTGMQHVVLNADDQIRTVSILSSYMYMCVQEGCGYGTE